jgi:alkylhydroperoxidase/carboxymuconolactone decarboxylase family protein YurZ
MLSTKEKALVGIGAAMTAGCQPCTRKLIGAARSAGACERSIRLAIETGLAARTSATEAMARWADAEQGQIPILDESFRLEKIKLCTLISAGATYAANSTATLNGQIDNAMVQGWTDVQISEAFAVGCAVAKTAANKVEVAATQLGLSPTQLDSSCCSEQPIPEVTQSTEPHQCGCAKSAQGA